MKVKEILEKERLRQCEVIRDTGINPSRFNAFLNGWLPLPEKCIDRLAKYLEVNPDQIRKESDSIRRGSR